MKAKVLLVIALLVVTNDITVSGQGTLVYDQESSSDESFPVGSGGRIQFYGSVGQSFTPSLSTVGFVRLKLFDIDPGNAMGATLVVNLRTNAITGTVLGSSLPVSMTDGFTGGTNFYFASPVPVIPNSTYFFETIVQSGDDWGFISLGDDYPNGTFYGGGFPYSGADLWFREGIIVPEPSSLALVFLGGGVALGIRRRMRPV